MPEPETRRYLGGKVLRRRIKQDEGNEEEYS